MKQFIQILLESKKSFFGFFIVFISLFVWNYIPGSYLLGKSEIYPSIYFFANTHAQLISGSVFQYGYVSLLLCIGTISVYLIFRNIIFKDFFERDTLSFFGSIFYLFSFSAVQFFYEGIGSYIYFWVFFPMALSTLMNMFVEFTRKNLMLFFLVNILLIPSFSILGFFIVYLFSLFSLLVGYSFIFKRSVRLRTFVTVFILFFVAHSFWLLPSLYRFIGESQTFQIELMSIGEIIDVMFSIYRQHVFTLLEIILFFYFLFVSIVGLFSKNKFARVAILFLLISLIGILFQIIEFYILYMFSYVLAFGLGLQMLYIAFDKRVVLRSGVSPTIFYVIFFLIIFICYSYSLILGKTFFSSSRIHIPQEYFELTSYLKSDTVLGTTVLLNEGLLHRKNSQFDLLDNENFNSEMQYALSVGDKSIFEDSLRKYYISGVVIDESAGIVDSKGYLRLNQIQKILSESTILKKEKDFGFLTLYRVTVEPAKNLLSISQSVPEIGPEYELNNFDFAYKDNGTYSTSGYSNAVVLYYPFRSLYTGRRQEDLEFRIKDNGDYFTFSSTLPKRLNGMRMVVLPTIQDEVTEISVDDLDTTTLKLPEIYLDGVRIQESELPLTYIDEGLLEVRVPKIKGYYSADTELFNNTVKQKSCDLSDNGTYPHNMVNENGKEWLRLTSLASSICLDFGFPNLVHRLPYLVTIESKNIQGKSLLFSLINKNTENAEIETYLSNSKDENISYFIVPPLELYGTGYTAHLENISLGYDKTVNDLGKITINPLPYSFLMGLKIVAPEAMFEKNTSFIVPQNVFYHYPGYYETNIDYSRLENNKKLTLVLSQRFEKGWSAYELASDSLLLDSWYSRLFIPIFGTKIQDHVKVNNWANGWNIKESNKTVIVLIYLPQYLEYFGFLLLLGFGAYLLLSSGSKKNDSTRVKGESQFRTRTSSVWSRVASKRFENKHATLTGPTPPGIGVYADTRSFTSSTS